MKKHLSSSVSDYFVLGIVYLNQKIKRIIAFILVVCFIGNSCIPAKHVAATTNYELIDTSETEVTDSEDESVTTKTDESIVYPTTEDADFDITSVAIKAEVANLRTANTKTFLRMDGTFVVAIYGETIHYEKDGKFYNIDNRLSYSDLTDSYRNTANTFSIDFPETITDGKSISLTQGEYEIKWRVDNVKNSTIAYDQ
jgi:hypothetical protein